MDMGKTYARIGEYIESRPSETYSQIASTLGLSRSQVTRIARLQGIKRGPGKRSAALEAAVAAIEAATPPREETVSAAPATPPMEATLSSTPAKPPAEIAVV